MVLPVDCLPRQTGALGIFRATRVLRSGYNTLRGRQGDARNKRRKRALPDACRPTKTPLAAQARVSWAATQVVPVCYQRAADEQCGRQH